MSSLVVVAPLAEGASPRARELVREGPPFDLPASDIERHRVYVTDREVVFVFEGHEPRPALEALVSTPGVWRAATSWRQILAGRPRIADEAFAWDRPGTEAR